MAKPKVFQVPAILDGISPRKDGGMGLRFVTNEIDAKDKVKLMDFYATFGWLQFSDNQLNSVPDEAAYREPGGKSPAQRLRNTLFVLWREKYADSAFDPWYEQQMERIINKIKEQLP